MSPRPARRGRDRGGGGRGGAARAHTGAHALTRTHTHGRGALPQPRPGAAPGHARVWGAAHGGTGRCTGSTAPPPPPAGTCAHAWGYGHGPARGGAGRRRPRGARGEGEHAPKSTAWSRHGSALPPSHSPRAAAGRAGPGRGDLQRRGLRSTPDLAVAKRAPWPDSTDDTVAWLAVMHTLT